MRLRILPLLTALTIALIAVSATLACNLESGSHAASAGSSHPAQVARTAQAGSFACVGAPEGVRSNYPEPRLFEESQSWWLQNGTPAQILTMPGAMDAIHVHLGVCFPQGETILEDNFSFKGTLHNQVGAVSNWVRYGFVGGEHGPGHPGGNLAGHENGFPWTPTDPVEEVKFFDFGGSYESLIGGTCGRKEFRASLNVDSTRFHKRQYQSFGSQAYTLCKPGQQSNNYRDSDVMIFRGWYDGPGYTNVAYSDESGHEGNGLHASDFYGAVPQNWQVKFGTSDVVDRWMLTVDPDVHHGSLGTVVAQGQSSISGQWAAIPVTELTPGIHKLALIGCQQAELGTNCGVGVIPFLVGANSGARRGWHDPKPFTA